MYLQRFNKRGRKVIGAQVNDGSSAGGYSAVGYSAGGSSADGYSDGGFSAN